MVQRPRAAVTNWGGGGTGYYISRYTRRAILSKHWCPYGFCHQLLLIPGHSIPKDIPYSTPGKETPASHSEGKTGHVKNYSQSKEIYGHVDFKGQGSVEFLLTYPPSRTGWGVVWMTGWGV